MVRIAPRLKTVVVPRGRASKQVAKPADSATITPADLSRRHQSSWQTGQTQDNEIFDFASVSSNGDPTPDFTSNSKNSQRRHISGGGGSGSSTTKRRMPTSTSSTSHHRVMAEPLPCTSMLPEHTSGNSSSILPLPLTGTQCVVSVYIKDTGATQIRRSSRGASQEALEDISPSIRSQVERLGGKFCTRVTKNTTHLIYTRGNNEWAAKATAVGAHVVACTWLTDCEKNNRRMPENEYPVGHEEDEDVLGNIVTIRRRNKSMDVAPFRRMKTPEGSSQMALDRGDDSPPCSPLPTAASRVRRSRHREHGTPSSPTQPSAHTGVRQVGATQRNANYSIRKPMPNPPNTRNANLNVVELATEHDLPASQTADATASQQESPIPVIAFAFMDAKKQTVLWSILQKLRSAGQRIVLVSQNSPASQLDRITHVVVDAAIYSSAAAATSSAATETVDARTDLVPLVVAARGGFVLQLSWVYDSENSLQPEEEYEVDLSVMRGAYIARFFQKVRELDASDPWRIAASEIPDVDEQDGSGVDEWSIKTAETLSLLHRRTFYLNNDVKPDAKTCGQVVQALGGFIARSASEADLLVTDCTTNLISEDNGALEPASKRHDKGGKNNKRSNRRGRNKAHKEAVSVDWLLKVLRHGVRPPVNARQRSVRTTTKVQVCESMLKFRNVLVSRANAFFAGLTPAQAGGQELQRQREMEINSVATRKDNASTVSGLNDNESVVSHIVEGDGKPSVAGAATLGEPVRRSVSCNLMDRLNTSEHIKGVSNRKRSEKGTSEKKDVSINQRSGDAADRSASNIKRSSDADKNTANNRTSSNAASSSKGKSRMGHTSSTGGAGRTGRNRRGSGVDDVDIESWGKKPARVKQFSRKSLGLEDVVVPVVVSSGSRVKRRLTIEDSQSDSEEIEIDKQDGDEGDAADVNDATSNVTSVLDASVLSGDVTMSMLDTVESMLDLASAPPSPCPGSASVKLNGSDIPNTSRNDNKAVAQDDKNTDDVGAEDASGKSIIESIKKKNEVATGGGEQKKHRRKEPVAARTRHGKASKVLELPHGELKAPTTAQKTTTSNPPTREAASALGSATAASQSKQVAKSVIKKSKVPPMRVTRSQQSATTVTVATTGLPAQIPSLGKNKKRATSGTEDIAVTRRRSEPSKRAINFSTRRSSRHSPIDVPKKGVVVLSEEEAEEEATAEEGEQEKEEEEEAGDNNNGASKNKNKRQTRNSRTKATAAKSDECAGTDTVKSNNKRDPGKTKAKAVVPTKQRARTRQNSVDVNTSETESERDESKQSKRRRTVSARKSLNLHTKAIAISNSTHVGQKKTQQAQSNVSNVTGVIAEKNRSTEDMAKSAQVESIMGEKGDASINIKPKATDTKTKVTTSNKTKKPKTPTAMPTRTSRRTHGGTHSETKSQAQEIRTDSGNTSKKRRRSTGTLSSDSKIKKRKSPVAIRAITRSSTRSSLGEPQRMEENDNATTSTQVQTPVFGGSSVCGVRNSNAGATGRAIPTVTPAGNPIRKQQQQRQTRRCMEKDDEKEESGPRKMVIACSNVDASVEDIIRGLVKEFSSKQHVHGRGGDSRNKCVDYTVMFFDSRLEDTTIGGLSGKTKTAPHITHIVTGNESKRTAKVLLGLARGAWVLRPSWVFASLEGQGWAEEEEHQVSSSVYGSVSTDRKANMSELLKGERVCINGQTFPPRDVVQSLVEALGGSIVLYANFSTLRIVAAEYSAKRHHKKAVNRENGDMDQHGCRVVDPAWLIQAVVSGELPPIIGGEKSF